MRTKAENASRLVKAAQRMAEKSEHWQVRSAIEAIQLYARADGESVYADGSCGSDVACTGDWNEITKYDQAHGRIVLSDLPARLERALSRLGFECEWCDEWSTCGECGGLVRTECDGFSWRPGYVYTDGEITCLGCLDVESYLASLRGQVEDTIPDGIAPEDHGYVVYASECDSRKVAKDLEDRGVYTYIVTRERWDCTVWLPQADFAALDRSDTSKAHLLAVMANEGACDPATEWVRSTITTDAAEIVRSALGSVQGRVWASWMWDRIEGDLAYPLPEWQAVYADWLTASDELDEACGS